MKPLICGIDEAGRGPVIGPMVLACAVFDESGAEELRKLKVRDSKKISKKRRETLYPKIKEISVEWHAIRISPYEIDKMRKEISLNVIEALYASKLILKLKTTPGKIIIDAADASPDRYKDKIIAFIKEKNKNFNIPIISEHKADDIYIEVSGASVIAKVARDLEIEKLVVKFGDLGSGYPSDVRTQEFLKNLMQQGELPDFVRKSWNTVKRNHKQANLLQW